jgi:hypothetical protein
VGEEAVGVTVRLLPVIVVGLLAGRADAEPEAAHRGVAGINLRAGADQLGITGTYGVTGGGRVTSWLWIHGRLEHGGWIVIDGSGGKLIEGAVGPVAQRCWRSEHVCLGGGIEGGVVRRVPSASGEARWHPLAGLTTHLDLAPGRRFSFRIGARAFHQWRADEPPGPGEGVAVSVGFLARW